MGVFKGNVSGLDFTSKIYGQDLQVIDGNLVVGYTGSLDKEIGATNVLSALKRRLMTELGQHPMDPSYGINLTRIIGAKNVATTKTILQQEIFATLLQDSRVSTVDSITVTEDDTNPHVYYVSIYVTLINQQVPVEVNLVYPWSVANVSVSTISDEVQVMASLDTVYTNFFIYDVIGVWLLADATKTGTNYWTGGSCEGNTITLGSLISANAAKVRIDYKTTEAVKDIGTFGYKSENVISTSKTLVNTIYNILDVEGVWLSEDTDQSGINYYLGGSFTANGITLGTPVPYTNTVLKVNYYAIS